MKVALWSASGIPVYPEHKDAFKKEMNAKMDKLEEEHGKVKADTAVKFQEVLVPYHEELMKKYPISTEVDLPSNEEEFKALCSKFNTAIAFCIEEDTIVGYVMDTPQ